MPLQRAGECVQASILHSTNTLEVTILIHRSAAIFFEVKPLLLSRRRRPVNQGALLVTKHGGRKLPGRRRCVPPRRGNAHHAIPSRVGIHPEEIGMTSNQPLRFIRLRFANFNQTAVGRNLIRGKHSRRSYKEEFIRQVHAYPPLQRALHLAQEVRSGSLKLITNPLHP